MKLIIVLAAIALAQADKLDNVYLPPNAHSGSSGGYPSGGFRGGAQRSGSASSGSSADKTATILRQDFTLEGGSYSYAYDTSNGIHGEEKGVATNGVQAQGGFSYTGDDGKTYAIWYTADENGFRPVGDHLPTPPPIPKEILKALEQNARDEAAGKKDDGSYSGGSQHSGYNNNAQSHSRGANVQKSYLPPSA
ncbi:unnamed protein product [Arctia plantaginis]|uniref:Uncharacterized protein n=1 Tax=Arctia plantaginis TaxID=874455 RepID=A0A8S1BA85_ARCPL|nr:unnamed protein product [Arctia plantaginis]CAB3255826.1 unnamed protein product [Arctia plantaginis]